MEIALATRSLDTAIDSTLRYYAFFRYPLTAAEIQERATEPCTLEEVEAYLYELEMLGQLHAYEGYYTLLRDAPALVARRKAGRIQADKDLRLARRIGAFIYQFPFVQFVGISGSLSKGFADRNSDFDFFIVTSGNRLWIARTLLHLFKKITFAAGQQHKFCMNYFIDEHALQLEEQNIYTATELSSLLPICGETCYHQLMTANEWRADFLPNRQKIKPETAIKSNRTLAAKIAEWAINKCRPELWNEKLMKLTDAKWQKKWARKNYPADDYSLAFKTTLHVSKNHKANYQKKVLEQVNKKIN